jgi:hypothetical protein
VLGEIVDTFDKNIAVTIPKPVMTPPSCLRTRYPVSTRFRLKAVPGMLRPTFVVSRLACFFRFGLRGDVWTKEYRPHPRMSVKQNLFTKCAAANAERTDKKTHATKLGNDYRASARPLARKYHTRCFGGCASLVSKVLKSRRESRPVKCEMWRGLPQNLISVASPEMPAAQRIPKSPARCLA